MFLCLSDYNYCNSTIVASAAKNYGGELQFRFSNKFRCHTRIEAPAGYTIHYKVNGLGPCECRKMASCPNRLRLTSDEAYLPWESYCKDASAHTEFIDLKADTLDIDLMFNDVIEDYSLSVDFFVSHYGRCKSYEVSCDRCIHKDLACDSTGMYCQVTNDLCSDISRQTFDTNAIAGIVVAAILFALLIFSCFRWHKQNSGSIQCCFGGEDGEGTMSPRAREILTNQLATRGVASSRTGRDNVAYTEDGERIDPSLAEPPPEYSSLENIDKRWNCYYEDEDLPPHYDDAIKNQEKYNVMGGIHHI